MRSHIINGHYMFGNTFIQPEVHGYKNLHHHMAPANRPMPPYPDMVNRPIQCPSGGNCYFNHSDGVTTVETPYIEDGNTGDCSECETCPLAYNGVIRDPLITSVVNIETSIIKTLKITLYGNTAERDKTVEMKTGSRYAVTYITEHGLVTSIGCLDLISDSIPDECTRYINSNNMAAVSSAFIGMDCSTEGYSDKRKIYISTIRLVQELDDSDSPTLPPDDDEEDILDGELPEIHI
jgi:hypothetical protein